MSGVKLWQSLPGLLLARWSNQPSAPCSSAEASWTGLYNRHAHAWDDVRVNRWCFFLIIPRVSFFFEFPSLSSLSLSRIFFLVLLLPRLCCWRESDPLFSLQDLLDMLPAAKGRMPPVGAPFFVVFPFVGIPLLRHFFPLSQRRFLSLPLATRFLRLVCRFQCTGRVFRRTFRPRPAPPTAGKCRSG